MISVFALERKKIFFFETGGRILTECLFVFKQTRILMFEKTFFIGKILAP